MLVVLMTSPALAAIGAMAGVVICSWFRRSTRMMPGAIGDSLSKGARGVLEVAVTCGMAGIIIGILTLTGLGLKFTGLLLALAGNNLPLLLILTAIVCLILGMGMPTPAAYIITAAVATPAIMKLGVSTMAAHLFVVYFAIISTITPPVALAAYAAAGLAKADPMKVGFIAVRLGIAAFIVPFMFVYAPELLMVGNWKWILWCFITASIGCYALARGVQYRSAPIAERILMFIASLLLIIPGLITDAIGFVLIAIALILRHFVYGIKGHHAVRLTEEKGQPDSV
jgi:TRAP transporter 4TM/12TM fusion protein